jgi:hypothetical protein
MFKKGDHIVILRDSEKDSRFIKHGYCFLQSKNLNHFYTDTDLTGTFCGIHSVKFKHNDTWRYATPEEIAEYNRLGKPFDVSVLRPKEKLLEEARKRYPVGSRVKSLYEDLLDTVKGQYHSNYPDGWKEGNSQIWFMGHVYGLLIYDEGKWAEVVFKPEEKGEEEHPDKIPVSKELTSLPEKWVVGNPNNEESEKLYDYANVHGVMPPYSIGTWFHFPSHEGCTTRGEIAPGYTEITFDQFKKWVLKESVEVSLVGRYLKALVRNPQSTPFKKGDYVGILRKLNNSQYKIEGDWTYTTNNSTASQWELMPEGFVPPESQSESTEKVEKVSEVPEYLECIMPEFWKDTIKKNGGNRIFHKSFKGISGETIGGEFRLQNRCFKPSTKEAYDAQSNPVKAEKESPVKQKDMTPAEKLGYEIGDKLRVIAVESKTFEMGDIVSLLKDDSSRCPLFKRQSDGRNDYCFLSDLERYTEEEDYQNLTDLEVGDTVRCISKNKSRISPETASSAGTGWKKDHEFVIDYVSSTPEGKVYWSGNYGVYSDAVRLVKKKDKPEPVKAPAEPEWTPKEGEWVKCIGDSNRTSDHTSLGWEKDLVFKIIKTETILDKLIAFGGKDSNGVWVFESNLRKALPHEIPFEHGPGITAQIESVKDYGVLTEERLKGIVSDLFLDPVKSETLAPEYIKCKSNGYSYRTHHSARQYGAENYAYGELPVDGKVYKVIRRVEINPGEFGYSCTLNGKDYLIGEKGVTIATYEEFCLQQSGNPCIIQDARPYDKLIEYPFPEELLERIKLQKIESVSLTPEASVPVISFLSPLR